MSSKTSSFRLPRARREPFATFGVAWAARLSSDDLRGLSPLIYTHSNPHGRFEVDVDRRTHQFRENGRMNVMMGIPTTTRRVNTPEAPGGVHLGWVRG